MDLIFAEATPPGRGGVSVIRLSGDGARSAAETLAGPLRLPRHAYFRALRHEGEVLDQALVLWFENGKSFTGEESAELHLHGAPVVARRVARSLVTLGARPAEAGEFTRRSFINGRMDLAEIEGLGDLLAAETELQRKQALLVASGHLTKRVDAWRNMLIRAGGLTESSIDFADEEVPEEVPAEVYALASQLEDQVAGEIQGFAAAEQIRRGFEVAIVGPPNAGKSSLMNALARREVALVSEIAGTTRDVIELRLELDGMAVTFLDTAGIRDADEEIERLGVERARLRALGADLRIHLGCGRGGVEGLWRDGDILATSKSDQDLEGEGVRISARTGDGLAELIKEVTEVLGSRVTGAGLVSHERQLSELMVARAALAAMRREDRPELVAEHLRAAASGLDRMVGRIGAEDYLDVVFSSFCIGK